MASPVADIEDDGQLDELETYTNYEPSKLKIGKPHPDSVVETATLANVEPPDIYYNLKLPLDSINKLSSLQLEAIVYACQQHECFNYINERLGFFIGDGTGVGKGRTIAGIIFENWIRGRKKNLWVTVSNDMKPDCIRDLADIGAKKIRVCSMLDFDYDGNEKLSCREAHLNVSQTREQYLSGVIVSSYSSIIGHNKKGKTRLSQLIAWFGRDFDGILVFDECHKAKNSDFTGSISKTAQCIIDLQAALPRARIVYSSATGASEIKHMGYMTRLGIWGVGTPFSTFKDFVGRVQKSDVEMLEILAMEMKQRGSYIARQLSFVNVQFSVHQFAVSEPTKLSYSKSVEFWQHAWDCFKTAINTLNKDTGRKTWALFWGSHLRFFRQLCLSAKVDEAVYLAKKAVQDGKCVVIGLQSTGETKTEQELHGQKTDIDNFVSYSKGILISLITDHFPVNETNPSFLNMKKDLLKNIDAISEFLPINALDDLIYKLGGHQKVAELSGRRKWLVKNYAAGFDYNARTRDQNNISERLNFMAGKKLFAVITEAASCGISLHCEKNAQNQKKRVHITLELPWSAEKALQQLGRTHRSNQAKPPEYIILISDLTAEYRCASAVSKRLANMGALTHADRRATNNCDLTIFNIDNKYGKQALTTIFCNIQDKNSLNSGMKLQQELTTVGILSKDTCSVSKFLNRIMGLRISLQNEVFQLFYQQLLLYMKEAKLQGTYNSGILRLKGQDCDKVNVVTTERYLRSHASGSSCVGLHEITVDRGMSWETAVRIEKDSNGSINGFYAFNEIKNGNTRIVFLRAETQKIYSFGDQNCSVYSPHLGLKITQAQTKDVLQKVHKISVKEAKPHWIYQYKDSARNCNHKFLFGKCEIVNCSYGKRYKTYHVLEGSLMLYWEDIEYVLQNDDKETKFQLVKVHTTQGICFNGVLIPEKCVTKLKHRLLPTKMVL